MHGDTHDISQWQLAIL